MIGNCKKVIALVLSCLLVLMPVCAFGDATQGTVSDIFATTWNEGMTSGENFRVINQDGVDVTEQMVVMYNQNGLQSVYDCVISNHYRMSYDLLETNLTTESAVERANKSVTVSHLEYETGYDEDYPSFVKEWRTKLKGTYVYTVGTDELINAAAPVLSLDYSNFGAMFAPRFDNVSTTYSINKSTNKVYFKATYRMRALCSVSVGDIPVGVDLDLGSYSTDFYAGP